MNESKPKVLTDRLDEINELKAAIAAYEAAPASHEEMSPRRAFEHRMYEYRLHMDNQRRLSLLTGQVFLGIRTFARDIGVANNIYACGVSRELQVKECGLVFSLAKSGERIQVLHASEHESVSLVMDNGQQNTFCIDDHDMDIEFEVTVRVFLTIAQAEAWVNSQKKLGHKGR